MDYSKAQAARAASTAGGSDAGTDRGREVTFS